MYCTKCGKEIDPNVGYCKDCEQNDTFFSSHSKTNSPYQQPDYWQTPYGAPEPQPVDQPPQAGDRKFGFGKALTATILGAISYIIMAFALGLVMGVVEELEAAYDTASVAAVATVAIPISLVIMAVSVGFAIPALILGIKSIKCFIRRKREGYVKPIATLVLGIVGVATTAFALLFAALTLLLFSALSLYL